MTKSKQWIYGAVIINYTTIVTEVLTSFTGNVSDNLKSLQIWSLIPCFIINNERPNNCYDRWLEIYLHTTDNRWTIFKHASEHSANIVNNVVITTCRHQCRSLHGWCQGKTSTDLLLQASYVLSQPSSCLPTPTTKQALHTVYLHENHIPQILPLTNVKHYQ